MPKNDATPEGRSQNLTFDWNGKIVIDIKALKRLQILANRCAEGLMNPRDCTVLLTSGLTQLAQGEEDFFHHLALDK